MRVEIVHTGGRYAERVGHCLTSLAPEEVEVFLVPRVSTAALEDATEALPTGLGAGEVIIALNLPPELLLAIPPLVGGAGVRALLVPVEDPAWIRPGQQRQVARACAEQGMEVAFPRPFCAFAPTTPVLTAFAEEFGVGAPELHFEFADGVVSAVDLRRGAPCGLTDALAQQLLGVRPEQLATRVARHHEVYPCLASTLPDPVIGQAAFAHAREQHCAAVERARAASVDGRK